MRGLFDLLKVTTVPFQAVALPDDRGANSLVVHDDVMPKEWAGAPVSEQGRARAVAAPAPTDSGARARLDLLFLKIARDFLLEKFVDENRQRAGNSKAWPATVENERQMLDRTTERDVLDSLRYYPGATVSIHLKVIAQCFKQDERDSNREIQRPAPR